MNLQERNETEITIYYKSCKIVSVNCCYCNKISHHVTAFLVGSKWTCRVIMNGECK